MDYSNIKLNIENNVATITFNRPKALNALNMALLLELEDALTQIKNDGAIQVLVLTGEGEKAFVAGADISEIAKFTPLQGRNFAQLGHRIFSAIESLPVPVIAAVNGFALGGGLEIALACDFIYASENAKFGLPEITLGLIPGFGGTQRLPRLIGKNMAKELMFTGSMVSAEQALTIGIVNKVVPQAALMDEVLKTAGIIAARGKVSLRAAKQTINSGLDVDLATGCKLEIDAFAMCLASPDSAEGTSAFLEKRKPEFKGTLDD